MSFAERYVGALTASLQDDEHHHATDPLCAAAIANDVSRGIGALLHRVKYGNATKRTFESGTGSLAKLQREWLAIVDKKGRDRNWIKAKDWPHIGHLFPAMAEKIASHSLAHYLDGNCEACNGTGAKSAKEAFKTCTECHGTRKAAIKSTPLHKLSAYEIDLIGQMVAELESLESSHAGVASALLKREG